MSEKAAIVAPKVILEKYSGILKAIDTGYYNNRIIRPGEKFLFEGSLVNGRFPQWCEKPADFEEKKKVKVEVKKEKVSDII